LNEESSKFKVVFLDYTAEGSTGLNYRTQCWICNVHDTSKLTWEQREASSWK